MTTYFLTMFFQNTYLKKGDQSLVKIIQSKLLTLNHSVIDEKEKKAI